MLAANGLTLVCLSHGPESDEVNGWSRDPRRESRSAAAETDNGIARLLNSAITSGAP